MAGWLLQKALHAFDWLIPAKHDGKPEHQRTGQAGEEIAYFHLRQLWRETIVHTTRAAKSI